MKYEFVLLTSKGWQYFCAMFLNNVVSCPQSETVVKRGGKWIKTKTNLQDRERHANKQFL